MHRLILMRHAKTERTAANGGGDHARALTDRGRADAALISQALAQQGLKPDLALVSDAVRTRQTWEEMRDALGDVEVRILADLYNADDAHLRRRVEAEEDNCGCLLVMAHNPGIHFLAHRYLVESAASPSILDRLAGGFPTGAAAVFAVDVAGRPTYDGYLIPKSLGGGAED